MTDVFLEGALRRALEPAASVPTLPPQPAALLRKQLAALSAWHLVNIARQYELTDLPVEALNAMPAVDLIDVIVAGVRAETGRRHPA